MSIENFKPEEISSPPFLTNLRNETSESHKELESVSLSKTLVSSQIKLSDYELYLSLMYDVVADFETKIYPIVQSVIPDILDRKKAYLILKDLNYLGKQKTNTISVLESHKKYSLSFAIGMLYVLEGSTLGGRFILKNIQENLHLDEENGISYFAGYGTKTGSFWKKFLQYITDYERETNSEFEIISGADYAFTTIKNHLSKYSPH